MVDLKTAIERISNSMWKPVNINTDEISGNALLFNATTLDEDSQYLIEDWFCDGEPEGLDFETKIPFAIVGFINGDNLSEGNIEMVEQPEHMLFMDIENGTSENIPIYSIDIDGTAIESTFQKLVGDFDELQIKGGFLEI